jgi:hypothetical protein
MYLNSVVSSGGYVIEKWGGSSKRHSGEGGEDYNSSAKGDGSSSSLFDHWRNSFSLFYFVLLSWLQYHWRVIFILSNPLYFCFILTFSGCSIVDCWGYDDSFIWNASLWVLFG